MNPNKIDAADLDACQHCGHSKRTWHYAMHGSALDGRRLCLVFRCDRCDCRVERP